MLKPYRTLLAMLALVLLTVGLGSVYATPLQDTAVLDITGQGLSLAEGGVGLVGLGADTRQITVDIGGPVEAALLYWAGRDRPCPEDGAGNCVIPSEPYLDQEMIFDGTPVTGTIIGTEENFTSSLGHTNNIGYFADVTAQVAAVGAGSHTFSIADGDPTSNLERLDGAGLVVVYEDPADDTSYRLLAFAGLDFAYHAESGDAQITEPVTFMYDPEGIDRTAQLTLFVGDAVANRPDRILISDNPTVENQLTAADGAMWDSPQGDIDVPAGTGATTVQLVSPTELKNSDSLLWVLAALRVPIPATATATPTAIPTATATATPTATPSAPPGDAGTGTPGYWKNHPEAWPVDEITIGGVTYTRDEAIELMMQPVKRDKTYTMFNALVAAKLNVLNGTDPGCIEDTIGEADDWMAAHGPVGSGVGAGGANSPWRDGEPLYERLDRYNNGKLCAPSRDSLE